MKGRILVFTFMIAAILVTEYALGTDQMSAATLISPSATPRKGAKPRPTTPLTPKKVKTFIGGTDEGSSIRPASAGSSTAATQSTPASVNRRPRNQDIEVENDETHWVGHDRTRRVRTINNSTANRSTPKKTRTETVDHNESRTNISGTTGSVNSTRKRSGQRLSGNSTPKQKKTNRPSVVPKPK
ncbi:MAG: hypothetical protein KA956_01790 [Pyrinomonadaceae bacterium]|nr:hypothetical protein [Acidobacteriota bacterium]MBK7934846.1 hypothetical protein [Acidobacteriota bacterium]MBP7375187.1 hypothetical protein [Pyrinomonadaceae bacterium]